ncbi:MAG TPA: hypothetical protein VG712_04320, partial [Gemmatimonadales bacterium]|nr:hypothetical protein [Gemmatimonadales bacterium]
AVKGYFSWRYTDSTKALEFDMYHSPDAWGRVHATMNDTGFTGRGESGGAGVAEIADSKEFVVARRIGPPNTGLCPRSTFEPLDRRAKPFPLAILGALWIGSLLYVKTR